MNLFSSKNAKKYFLTKKSEIQTKSKVDLVLSPEFYWIRVFEIPVENEKKALEVLPSLFEDILPNADFDYYVTKKEENVFICYAFNNDDILESIKKSGLSLSQVNSVYFAQTQMVDYASFSVDESTFTYDKDILIKVPSTLCKDAVVLRADVSEIEFNDHKINIKFYSNTVGSKYIYTLIILLCSIVLINMIRYIGHMNDIEAVNTKIEKIRQANNMPKSFIQTKSILHNMDKKVDKQMALRKALSYILEFKKSSNYEKIEKISFKDNKIKIVFSNSSWFKIKKHIEKRYKILNNSTKGSFVNVEVAI